MGKILFNITTGNSRGVLKVFLIETPCDPNFVVGKISKKMLLYRKYTGGLSELISVFPSFTASHDIFSAFDSRHVNANDVHKQRLDKKWATLSQAEKYSTKMQEVPFHLHHKVCLELDIPRFDGKDVREFASKLGITVLDCARLQQAAKIHNTTTTFIILQQTPGITVGDFVNIMKEMGRQDIADLIN